jgi:hypothetical protein
MPRPKKLIPGEAFEKAVQQIQQKLDPNTTVTHNERLPDRVGNKRQYDVVIRGTLGGRPVLGVMECKDHNKPKGPESVDAFANKVRNVGADFSIMVSRLGFTKQALRLAKFEKIICYSVASKEFEQEICFGQYLYGTVRKWKTEGCRISFRGQHPQPAIEQIVYQQKPVLNWILADMINNHSDLEPGSYYYRLLFPNGLPVEVNGSPYSLHELGVQATLVQQIKRTFIHWTGAAFYDWDQEKLHIPGKEPLLSSAIDGRMHLWEDYVGEVPPHTILRATGGQVAPTDVPDLDEHSIQWEILYVPKDDPTKFLR